MSSNSVPLEHMSSIQNIRKDKDVNESRGVPGSSHDTGKGKHYKLNGLVTISFFWVHCAFLRSCSLNTYSFFGNFINANDGEFICTYFITLFWFTWISIFALYSFRYEYAFIFYLRMQFPSTSTSSDFSTFYNMRVYPGS